MANKEDDNKITAASSTAVDPVLAKLSIEQCSPESMAIKWIDFMRSAVPMPPLHNSHGFLQTLVLRHLTVDRVQPGLLISTLIVKPSITNRYNTLHGGAVTTVASIVGLAAVKTLAGDKDYFMAEMGISYIYAARVGVELEIEAKVLRFGKSVAVSSIDIRNKDTKQGTFKGRCTFYNKPTSRI